MTDNVAEGDGKRISTKRFCVGPWIYHSRTGELFHHETGLHIATGYSGRPSAMNNPAMAHLKGIGPIPAGLYFIHQPRHSEKTGRFVLDLTPVGHKALGRTGLQIHGDNAARDGTASSGCIVLGPAIRTMISNGVALINVIDT